jgi:transcriptional regulator with PAS, ATPase and Fis domain
MPVVNIERERLLGLLQGYERLVESMLADATGDGTLQEIEITIARRRLIQHAGSKRDAARSLGISVQTLSRYLRLSQGEESISKRA